MTRPCTHSALAWEPQVLGTQQPPVPDGQVEGPSDETEVDTHRGIPSLGKQDPNVKSEAQDGGGGWKTEETSHGRG